MSFTTPIFQAPVFSLPILMSVGIPLFIVTMTSQNIPGIAVMQGNGYALPISPVISWTGLVNLILAPFGSYSICLTALTAAICSSKEADPDPALRYKSTLVAGFCWLLIGLFGATIVSIFFAFPKELILALAGLALLSTIGTSLHTALKEEDHRESALITILVSASGMNLLGIGAAFWGLIAGIIALMIQNWRKQRVLIAT